MEINNENKRISRVGIINFDGMTLIYGLCIILFAWGYKAVNYVITYDEESIGETTSLFMANMGMGRPLLALLSEIIPIRPVTGFETFLFATILYISAVILWNTFEMISDLDSRPAFALCVASFVGMPAHLYTMMFSYQSIPMALGYLFAILFVYYYFLYLRRNRKTYLIYALLFSCLPILMYQSFVVTEFMILCFGFLLISLNKNDNKTVWKDFFIGFAVIIVALIVYFCITKLFAIFIPSSGYVEGYMKWDFSNPMGNIRGIVGGIKLILLGKQVTGFKYLPFFVLLFTLASIVCVGRSGIKFFSFCMLAGTFASLFSMEIVIGGMIGERILMGIPVFPFISIYLTLYIFRNVSVLNKLIYILSLYVCFLQIYTLNDLCIIEKERYDRDCLIANEIYERVVKESEYNCNTIAIVCPSDFRNRNDGIGLSLFDIGGERACNFMQKKYYDLKMCSEEQYEFAKSYSVNMQPFPLDGSVVYLKNEDLVIVNLPDGGFY